MSELKVKNISGKEISVMWNGSNLNFEENEVKVMNENLAHAVVSEAKTGLLIEEEIKEIKPEVKASVPEQTVVPKKRGRPKKK